MTWPQCARLLSALERALAMFATGDTGRILASIIEGEPHPSVGRLLRIIRGSTSNLALPSVALPF